ncbi:hypothetical protein FOZ62_003785, partial [Perkinsus olseni]
MNAAMHAMRLPAHQGRFFMKPRIGLSLTGVNAVVVRLTAVEVTARMLHGETASDAMQSGFNDVQQGYLDTAQLPGAASEDRATAGNLIEN